jgi:uncharacterized protein (DUF2141 family)
MNRLARVVVVFGAISLALAGCSAANASGGGNTSNLTYTLSGSVATPNGATVNNGTYVYLKLVTSGGAFTAPALYWTRGAFSGGSASYSISGISAGTYTGWVFIDMNGDAPDNSSALPDTGDYSLSAGQPITISGDQTQNVGVNGWQKDS